MKVKNIKIFDSTIINKIINFLILLSLVKFHKILFSKKLLKQFFYSKIK